MSIGRNVNKARAIRCLASNRPKRGSRGSFVLARIVPAQGITRRRWWDEDDDDEGSFLRWGVYFCPHANSCVFLWACKAIARVPPCVFVLYCRVGLLSVLISAWLIRQPCQPDGKLLAWDRVSWTFACTQTPTVCWDAVAELLKCFALSCRVRLVQLGWWLVSRGRIWWVYLLHD